MGDCFGGEISLQWQPSLNDSNEMIVNLEKDKAVSQEKEIAVNERKRYISAAKKQKVTILEKGD